MEAVELLQQLKHRGFRLSWGSNGRVRSTGDLGKLPTDYKVALSQSRDEVENLVKWQTLQDREEQRFGNRGARFYIFLALNLEDALVVRTVNGRGRILRVMPDYLNVISENKLKKWRTECRKAKRKLPLPSPMAEFGFDEVFPPTTPPPDSWLYKGDPYSEVAL